MTQQDEYWMDLALQAGQEAGFLDEVPIGAVLVREGTLIAKAFNQCIHTHDPTAHAEIQCLREAGQFLQNYRFNHCTLYVTLEPCIMCFTALHHARIETLVYAAPDPKMGFTNQFQSSQDGPFFHHMQIRAGCLEERAVTQIKTFFQQKRARGKRKWLKSGGNHV